MKLAWPKEHTAVGRLHVVTQVSTCSTITVPYFISLLIRTSFNLCWLLNSTLMWFQGRIGRDAVTNQNLMVVKHYHNFINIWWIFHTSVMMELCCGWIFWLTKNHQVTRYVVYLCFWSTRVQHHGHSNTQLHSFEHVNLQFFCSNFCEGASTCKFQYLLFWYLKIEHYYYTQDLKVKMQIDDFSNLTYMVFVFHSLYQY